MSAFIVGNAHISAMLQHTAPKYPGDDVSYYWAEKHHPVNGNKQAVAQMLVDENYRSFNCRYRKTEKAHDFQAVHTTRRYSPVEIIKACDCYEYQACESPDWKDTEAYAIVQMLHKRATRQLPGYDEADWGI